MWGKNRTIGVCGDSQCKDSLASSDSPFVDRGGWLSPRAHFCSYFTIEVRPQEELSCKLCGTFIWHCRECVG